jgi:hypothetical protein
LGVQVSPGPPLSASAAQAQQIETVPESRSDPHKTHTSRFDVTIAGELNLDLLLYGLPDELPPERELLADGMMLTLGSSSAIVATISRR